MDTYELDRKFEEEIYPRFLQMKKQMLEDLANEYFAKKFQLEQELEEAEKELQNHYFMVKEAMNS